MMPTDEELLHNFYAGDSTALQRLVERHQRILGRIAYLILQTRTGSEAQAFIEWDLDERLISMWTHVLSTREVNVGRWPHQRLSVLTWLIHLVSLVLDRHLGFRGPF